MPYALVPDGYTLKKVTKLQKDAVDAKRRHDDVVALLANPNTPLVAGAAAGAFFFVRFADQIIAKLIELGVNVSDEIKDEIKKLNPFTDIANFVPGGPTFEEAVEKQVAKFVEFTT